MYHLRARAWASRPIQQQDRRGHRYMNVNGNKGRSVFRAKQTEPALANPGIRESWQLDIEASWEDSGDLS